MALLIVQPLDFERKSSLVFVYTIELRNIFYRKEFHKPYPCTHALRVGFGPNFLGLEEAEKRKEFFFFA